MQTSSAPTVAAAAPAAAQAPVAVPVPVAPPATVAAPTPAAAPAVGAAERSRWWAELLAVGWLAWLYDEVTGLAPLRQAAALSHGRSLLHIERSLHVAVEHGMNVWLAAHHTLGVALSYYYDNAHFVVTFGVLGWLWWKRPDIYRPLRNALVGVNLIGLLVFWRFPVAPPRMLGGFTDVIASSHALGSWHTGSLAADADQLAAMPSLHIAWAVWCTVALWQVARRRPAPDAHSNRGGRPARERLLARFTLALAVLYPCLTAVVVLATANHYLLDVLAGLATTAVAVALVRVPHVTKLLRSRRSC